MSKPDAPPSPDYAALAQQQGAANRETAIAEFGLNNSNQNTPWGSRTLTPTGQDAQGNPTYEINTTLNGTDQANLNRQRAIQTSLLQLAPTAMDNVWGQIGHPMSPNALNPLTGQVDADGTQRVDYSGLNPSTSHVNASPVQSNLDYSGLQNISDPTALRQQVADSRFNQFASRFMPAAESQQDQMRTRIANMGGVSDSQGANRMMGGLLTNQGDQFRQGVWDSVNGADASANQVFGQQLAARQQGAGEVGQQGAFYNNAQDQNFNQGMGNANLNNATRGADAGLLQNQVQTNNAANQTDVGNAFANASLGNQSRAQGLQEQQALRQMPLNELMAMLSGSQVNQPQFQPATATSIAPPPIFQAGQAQGQFDQQNYQNGVSSSNNLMNTAGTIGSAALMAF